MNVTPRFCEWARQLDVRDELAHLFAIREVPVGRDTRIGWQAQIEEEGWILGVAFGGSGAVVRD